MLDVFLFFRTDRMSQKRKTGGQMQHAEKRLIKPVGTKFFYELPLNSPAGFLLETGEIDPYDTKERKAILEIEAKIGELRGEPCPEVPF